MKVNDIRGCPKPAFDTILVLIEDLVADAGPRDTIIVVGQPLQLNATSTGGTSYTWNPVTGLNNALIANPVAILPSTIDSIRYIISYQGWYSNS